MGETLKYSQQHCGCRRLALCGAGGRCRREDVSAGRVKERTEGHRDLRQSWCRSRQDYASRQTAARRGRQGADRPVTAFRVRSLIWSRSFLRWSAGRGLRLEMRRSPTSDHAPRSRSVHCGAAWGACIGRWASGCRNVMATARRRSVTSSAGRTNPALTHWRARSLSLRGVTRSVQLLFGVYFRSPCRTTS